MKKVEPIRCVNRKTVWVPRLQKKRVRYVWILYSLPKFYHVNMGFIPRVLTNGWKRKRRVLCVEVHKESLPLL